MRFHQQFMNLFAFAGLTGPAKFTVTTSPEAAPAPDATASRVLVRGTYQPSTVTAAAGQPIRLVFERTSHSPCTRELVFPTLGLRRHLPVDVPVTIELPAQVAGEIPFHCGMRMVRGTLVVTAAP